MTNAIIEKVEQWLWSIAIKKGVYSIVKVVVAFITSVKIAPILEQWGVKVDPVTLTGALTSGLTGLLTVVQNWLKMKMGWNWL